MIEESSPVLGVAVAEPPRRRPGAPGHHGVAGCAALDGHRAGNGQLHVFDSGSGGPLVDAVSASGAVPGVWPLQRIAGRAFVDGGMVSAANAHLADGYGRVVVVAPDESSATAIGPNTHDPTRRRAAAGAGRRQGTGVAAQVAATWS